MSRKGIFFLIGFILISLSISFFIKATQHKNEHGILIFTRFQPIKKSTGFVVAILNRHMQMPK